MTLEKTNFSSQHILDNEMAYFSLLESAVNSVDEHSVMAVTRTPQGYTFRISPSSPKYINLLIQQLTEMNKFFGIMLNFSKSIKSSSSISFSISYICKK
jgi:hypothetical protein